MRTLAIAVMLASTFAAPAFAETLDSARIDFTLPAPQTDRILPASRPREERRRPLSYDFQGGRVEFGPFSARVSTFYGHHPHTTGAIGARNAVGVGVQLTIRLPNGR